MSTRVLGDLKHVLHHVCMTLTWLSVMTEVLSLLFRSMSTPLFFMVWAMPPEGKSQCYSIQHIRQKWASNFVPEVCIWPFSAWQCLFAHIFFTSLVWPQPHPTPLGWSGMPTVSQTWSSNISKSKYWLYSLRTKGTMPVQSSYHVKAMAMSPVVSLVSPVSVVCVCLLVSLTCISSLCLPSEEMRDVKTEELRLPNEKFLVTSDVLHSW